MTIATVSDRIVQVAKVLGAVGVIWAVGGSAYSVSFGKARELLDAHYQMQADIIELRAEIASLKGEDKIIREKPGLTYVSEPVYENEPIIFNMVAERTRLGEGCILQYSQPIFTDQMNVPTPGQRRMAARQIDRDPTPLRPGYMPPDNLRPGRVTVYLILAYECDGNTLFDQTSTAAFELLAGPRPD